MQHKEVLYFLPGKKKKPSCLACMFYRKSVGYWKKTIDVELFFYHSPFEAKCVALVH